MTSHKDVKDLVELEPAELVLARCEAFRCHDFRFIFNSYHEDAPFLQAFPDCGDYLDYAERALRSAFSIKGCRVVRVRAVGEGEVQVLFMLEVASQGQLLTTVELACLRHTGEGWRYHSGAKRPRTDFDCPPEEISFHDFLDCESLVFF